MTFAELNAKGAWVDPAGGQTTLSEFLPDFWDAIDVDLRTEENHRSIVRKHIQPHLGRSHRRMDRSPLGRTDGLQRHNLHLFDDDTGFIIIDPDTLHESASGQLWLGQPKTEAFARTSTISLVPFNVRLLGVQLALHNHPHVFISPDDGNLHIANPRIRLHPAKPSLTFRGARYSHKPGWSTTASPKSPKHSASDTSCPTKSKRPTPTSPTPSKPASCNTCRTRGTRPSSTPPATSAAAGAA